MKFNDVIARLAIAADEEVGDFAESFRILRLMVPTADDGRTFPWAHGVTLKTVFYAKGGPGGGVLPTPAAVGFVLTALLLDVPRREIAQRAMDVQFALTPMTPRGRRIICPRTKETVFGAALAKCLADRDLFNDLTAISISAKFGMAQLTFKSDMEEAFKRDTEEPRKTHWWKGSPTFMAERNTRIGIEDIGLQRMATLYMKKVRFLFDAIHEPEQVAVAMR